MNYEKGILTCIRCNRHQRHISASLTDRVTLLRWSVYFQILPSFSGIFHKLVFPTVPHFLFYPRLVSFHTANPLLRVERNFRREGGGWGGDGGGGRAGMRVGAGTISPRPQLQVAPVMSMNANLNCRLKLSTFSPLLPPGGVWISPLWEASTVAPAPPPSQQEPGPPGTAYSLGSALLNYVQLGLFLYANLWHLYWTNTH